jgi:hypothetical protein
MPAHQEEVARLQELIVEYDLRVPAQIERIERMIEQGLGSTEAQDSAPARAYPREMARSTADSGTIVHGCPS